MPDNVAARAVTFARCGRFSRLAASGQQLQPVAAAESEPGEERNLRLEKPGTVARQTALLKKYQTDGRSH